VKSGLVVMKICGRESGRRRVVCRVEKGRYCMGCVRFVCGDACFVVYMESECDVVCVLEKGKFVG
jgi:hypothetical protein